MSAADETPLPVAAVPDDGRPIASVQERLVGRLVDLLVHIVAGVIISLPFSSSDGDAFTIVAIITAVTAFAWETIWLVRSGATMGKHLTGTRVVVRSDPWAQPGIVQSGLRSAPRLLWGLPFALIAAIPVGLISLVLLVGTSRHQTLADIVARTVVVSIREPATIAPSVD